MTLIILLQHYLLQLTKIANLGEFDASHMVGVYNVNLLTNKPHLINQHYLNDLVRNMSCQSRKHKSWSVDYSSDISYMMDVHLLSLLCRCWRQFMQENYAY